MEYPIFNIIVPVYNAEKYIGETIESVLCQTYPCINLILVDDGSTDKSGSVCDKYAEENNIIQVLHNSNQGVSTTRNDGLTMVKDGYVCFLDSDDVLCDAQMFEKISNIIINNNPDYIDFGINYVSRSGEISKNISGVKKDVLLDRKYIHNYLLPPLLNLTGDKENFVFDFAWNKVYKSTIINNYNIKFISNRRVWEDRPFVIDYLSHCNNAYSMKEYFYNYMDVDNSLSRRYTNEFFDVIIENYLSYKNTFGKEYDFETQYVYHYWCNSLIKMIEQSLSQSKVNESEVVEKINEIFSKREVIDLFEKRIPENSNEKKVSKYVVNGDINGLISHYKKYIEKNLRKSNVRNLFSSIKNKIVK